MTTETANEPTDAPEAALYDAPPKAEAPPAVIKTEAAPVAAKPDEPLSLSLPEGVQADDAVLSAFRDLASELKLPNDQAQRIVSELTPLMQQRQLEQVQQARRDWVDSVQQDEELGGTQLENTLRVAKRALNQLGTPELADLLEQSGLGDHPQIIRLFYRAGQAISEDQPLFGTRGAPPKSAADILFGDTMNG